LESFKTLEFREAWVRCSCWSWYSRFKRFCPFFHSGGFDEELISEVSGGSKDEEAKGKKGKESEGFHCLVKRC
jgi:hypothetical protein